MAEESGPPQAARADRTASQAPHLPILAGVCAACGAPGKPVAGQTVKALIAESLRSVSGDDYLFCPTQTCTVVYFAADRTHAFTSDQLREHVYQKMPDDPDVWICYCFRYRVGDVRRASTEECRGIIADITAGIQAGQCACDLRNPQGACCLGNVRAVVKQEEARN